MRIRNFRMLGLLALLLAVAPIQGHADNHTDGTADGSGAGDFIERYVFGEAGASVSVGDNERSLYLAQIGVDYTFDKGRVYLLGKYYNSSLEIEQKKIFVEPGEPATRKIKFSESKGLLEEAFVQYKLHDNIIVDIGRKKTSFGQFDLFSPIDAFTLPYRSSVLGFELDKSVFRMPQDTISLLLPVSDRFEVQLHYFNGVRLDPLVDKARDKSDISRFNGIADGDDDIMSYQRKGTNSLDQVAFRVLHYYDRGTLSFTYYDGYNSLDYQDSLTLKAHTDVSDSSPDGTYYVTNAISRLPDLKLYGFDASYVEGDWVWKMEVAYVETEEGLILTNSLGIGTGQTPPQPTKVSGEEADYYNWITTRHGNRAYVDEKYVIAGVGFNVDLDRWNLDIALYSLISLSPDQAKKLYSLEKAAGKVLGFKEDRNESKVAPGFHVSYDLTGEEDEIVGLAGGFLGNGSGVTLYYSYEYNDNLSLGAGLEYIEYDSDSYVHDANNPGRAYTDDELGGGAVRLGIRYKF